MPKIDVDISGPEQTRAVALALAPLLDRGDLLILSGELGAGKTTFTRSLGEGLGVRSGVISPTFVISRVHPNLADGVRPGGPDLVHVDAYRLSSPEEIDDLDLEYSMDRSVTVVEWGRDKVEHLSDSRLEVELTRVTGADIEAGLQFVATEDSDPWQEQSEDAYSEDADDAPEPRSLRIVAVGPRWDGAAWDELVSAVGTLGSASQL